MKYKITRNNRYVYATRLLVSMCLSAIVSMLTVAALAPKYMENMIIFTTLFLTLWYFLMRLTEKIFTKKNMTIESKSDSLIFILKNNAMITIKWQEIDQYAFQNRGWFSSFSIKSVTGERLKFDHFSDSQDDFSEFRSFFENKMFKMGLKSKTGQGIYGTNLAKYSAVLLLSCMIAIPVILHIQDSTPDWGFMLIFYPSSSFFIYQTYTTHKLRVSKD